MEMNGSVLDEKLYFKILGLSFYFKLDCVSYIVETASKKMSVVILSVTFLSFEVVL